MMNTRAHFSSRLAPRSYEIFRWLVLEKEFFLVLLLSWFLYFFQIKNIPVPTVDGAIRAVLARELVEAHRWFPFTWDGSLFVDHPPLFIWITALCQKIGGITPLATNFGFRFFSFLLLPLTYVFSRTLNGSRLYSLLACIILVSTRDFSLSQVRGYIEPVLSFFSYLAVLFLLLRPSWFFRLLSGTALTMAFLAKGPPALWPAVFCFGLLILQNTQKPEATPYQWRISWLKLLKDQFLLILPTLILIIFCINKYKVGSDFKIWFDTYLNDQVLQSALHGRHDQQTLEPFYFTALLGKHYWPWLPFLFLSFFYMGKKRIWLPLLFAGGFLAGFSLVKWKFWYYTVPCYPGFSVAIALTLQTVLNGQHHPWKRWNLWFPYLPHVLGSVVLVATLIMSTFPISTFLDRIPEVRVFAPVILLEQQKVGEMGHFLPIFQKNQQIDHNMMNTSGLWEFRQQVIRCDTQEEFLEKSKTYRHYFLILPRHEEPLTLNNELTEKSLRAQTDRSSLWEISFKK